MHPTRLLAELTAYQAGYIVGTCIAGFVAVSVYVFAVMAIVKAFTRRTRGWIVAGSCGGAVMLLTWLGMIAGIVGALSARAQAARHAPTGAGGGANGSTAYTAPETVSGRVLPYHIDLPEGWSRVPNLSDFDLATRRDNTYFGVIAEEGSLGTPENIAEVARKRLSGKATEVQFSEPTPERIDGRAWVRFTARCRIGGLPVAYQFHAYSGDEGTFQLVGWTLQNQYEQSEGTLHVLATSFRFPARRVAASLPVPSSTPAAPQTLRGHNLPYELRPPADWLVRPPQGEFDLLVKHGSLYVGVTADDGLLGTTDVVVKSAQEELRKAAKDVQLSAITPVQIDGRGWRRFSAKCLVENLPITYQYSVYTGPEGTFEIIGWTMQNLYDRDAGKLDAVAGTFRFAGPEAPGTSGPEAAAGTAQAPQTVHGNGLAYRLTVPGGWKVKDEDGVFDLMVTHMGAGIGVVAEEGSMGSPQAALALVQTGLRKTATECRFSPTTTVKIDGHDWLRFTATCKVDGLPLANQHYVYAGKEGTYRLTCWSAQNVAGRYADTLQTAAMSFRFPPAASPAPTAADAAPAEPPKPSATPARRWH